MIHIHFIVNPIAGSHKSLVTVANLEPYFIRSLHVLTVKHSQYKGHSIELTSASIAEKAAIIVACGGDGTINEVASCLVHTSIPLGIIPLGSGNGLASNLNIPKNLRKALAIIKNQNTLKIDVGNINNRYFFSNMGIGFDALTIKKYESSNKRTLISYILACFIALKEIKYGENIELNINNTLSEISPFLIFISNSNELGYKFSLTPKALLHDGLLDVLIVKKISKLKMLWFGFLVLLNKPLLLKEANYYQTNTLNVKNKKQDFFETQVDGEFTPLLNQKLSISIHPEALKVIVPEKNSH